MALSKQHRWSMIEAISGYFNSIWIECVCRLNRSTSSHHWIVSFPLPLFHRVWWPEVQSESDSCSCTQTTRKKQSIVGPLNQPPPQVCTYWHILCFYCSVPWEYPFGFHIFLIISWHIWSCFLDLLYTHLLYTNFIKIFLASLQRSDIWFVCKEIKI